MVSKYWGFTWEARQTAQSSQELLAVIQSWGLLVAQSMEEEGCNGHEGFKQTAHEHCIGL